MYQQYSSPVVPCSPHSHTKMSHTDFRAASHTANPPFSPDSGTTNAVNNTKLPNSTAFFQIYVITKIVRAKIKGMTRSKLLPQCHEYLTSFWSIHLFLRCRLLWKCGSKQWHFILQHIQSNPYELFTINIQLSFIVCRFKQRFIREYRVWQFGLCKMAGESVTWSSSVLL